MEKLSGDEADQAQQINEEFTEKSIAACRAKAQAETHPDFDGIHCVDCDEPIPEARLKMGKVRCVYCQQKKERQEQLYKK